MAAPMVSRRGLARTVCGRALRVLAGCGGGRRGLLVISGHALAGIDGRRVMLLRGRRSHVCRRRLRHRRMSRRLRRRRMRRSGA